MICPLCKGEMKKGNTPIHIDRSGYHITFDNVLAWVCTQCGEPYFEEKQVDEIQKAIGEMDKHMSIMLLPA